MSKQNVQQLSKQAKDAQKKIADLTTQYAKLDLLGTIYNTICLEKKAATNQHERITVTYNGRTINMKIRANMTPAVIDTAIKSRFQIKVEERLLLLDQDRNVVPIDTTLTTGKYILETPSIQKKQVSQKKQAATNHEGITITRKGKTMNMRIWANMTPKEIDAAIRSHFQVKDDQRLLLLDADRDVVPIDATLLNGEYILETPSLQKKQVAQGFVGEVHKGAECKESSRAVQDVIKGQHLYEGQRLTADFTDEKWIARHRYMYDKLDKDGNGFVTLDEFVYKASVEICGGLGATKAQTKRHTQAVINFFSGAGMKFGVEQHWTDYIKGWEKLVNEELDRWANKEPTLIREWGEALFDIIDTSGNGSIDLEEWTRYQVVAQVVGKLEDSKAIFDICDINKDGKIEIDEMCRQHVGFWYTADPASDGLYGPLCP